MREPVPPILFLSSLTTDSGSGIRFWNMARAVAAAGWPVTYYERRPPDLPPRQWPGIDYRSSLERPGLAGNVLRSLAGGLRLALGRRWRAVYALKPLPNSAFPALAARCRGAWTALDVDDLDAEYYPPGWHRQLTGLLLRRLPSRFQSVSYHTTPLGRLLRERARVRPERLHRVRQGLDADLFHTARGEVPRAVRDFCARRQVIVYMASLGITSDFEDILPMLRTVLEGHPQRGVLVLGRGCRMEAFRQQACRPGLEDRLLFFGYANHHQVPAILAGCRAGLHYMRPGGANDYRAVMKIREYLAAGLPVVANDSGDAAEFAPFLLLAGELTGYPDLLAQALAGEAADRTAAGQRYVLEELAWPRLAPEIFAALNLPAAPAGE